MEEEKRNKSLERLKQIAQDKNAEWLGYSNINAIIDALDYIKELKEYLEVAAAANRMQYDFGWKACESKSIFRETIENQLKELERQEKQELKGLKGQDRYFVKQLYMAKKNTYKKILEG